MTWRSAGIPTTTMSSSRLLRCRMAVAPSPGLFSERAESSVCPMSLASRLVANETHIFTPHLLNDFRARLHAARQHDQRNKPWQTPPPSSLGIPGIPTNAAFNNALPLFTFTGFQQLGPSASTFSALSDCRVANGRHVVLYEGKHIA